MEETLSIKQAAKYLNCHPHTVRQHLYEWGFFRMEGSRLWRVHKSDLDSHKNKTHNDLRVLSVGHKQEDKLCRSTNEKIAKSGGLISLHQVGKELDGLLKQPSKRKP